MFKIIVRAKKDADAIKAMLNKFYSEWNIDVNTFKGIRGVNAREILKNIIEEDKYNIVLLGREDSEISKLEREFFPRAVFHVIPKKKIRNERIYNLAKEFEKARSKYRCIISWSGRSYIIGPLYDEIIFNEICPAYDNFILYGKGREMLESFLGPLKGVVLLVRKFGGEHEVFVGKSKVGIIKIPDFGKIEGSRLDYEVNFEVKLSDMVEDNRKLLVFHENIALTFLSRFKDNFDVFVVPWSGGKDSTTALILASKCFSKKKLYAVYVDTGVDFPENLNYVKKVANQVNVKLEMSYAEVKEQINNMGFPTHDNRWCTKLKIVALYKKLEELKSEGRLLIIVGDRDAESELRSKRAPFRKHNEYFQVAPLKMWSATMVHLYLIMNNVPINPLYELGFYRLGCYICPALRSWELYIIRHSHLFRELENKPYFKEFLKIRGRQNSY